MSGPPNPSRPRRLQLGVTAAELAIVAGIAATLVATVAPDFSTLVANAQLRAASEGLRSGLRLAQLEAIKRQGPVELVLTDDAPTAATVDPSPGGRNWVIRAPLPDGGFELIDAAAVATQASRVRVEADRSVFAFDRFGRLRADSYGNAAPNDDLRIDFADRDARGRPLRIVVRPAGSSLGCDPNARDDDPPACG